jgi:uncharacterized phiE125 gp8 family phage protein
MALTFVGYGAPDGNGDVSATPIAEPLTLAEAKRQVRRTDLTDDDELLDLTLIPAVRERAEQATRRQLITATWDLKGDRFPCGDEAIVLPVPPLLSVVFVKYVDTAGALQTWSSSNYVVDAPAGARAARGRLTLAYGALWPVTRDQANAVTIRFTCGYGLTANSVPPRLKMAMLLDLGTLYENREDQVVGQGYAITPFPNGSDNVYRAFKSY